MPNIRYHRYQEVGNFKLHGKIPLGVIFRCDLFQKMEDDKATGKFNIRKYMVLMNNTIHNFMLIIMAP